MKPVPHHGRPPWSEGVEHGEPEPGGLGVGGQASRGDLQGVGDLRDVVEDDVPMVQAPQALVGAQLGVDSEVREIARGLGAREGVEVEQPDRLAVPEQLLVVQIAVTDDERVRRRRREVLGEFRAPASSTVAAVGARLRTARM